MDDKITFEAYISTKTLRQLMEEMDDDNRYADSECVDTVKEFLVRLSDDNLDLDKYRFLSPYFKRSILLSLIEAKNQVFSYKEKQKSKLNDTVTQYGSGIPEANEVLKRDVKQINDLCNGTTKSIYFGRKNMIFSTLDQVEKDISPFLDMTIADFIEKNSVYKFKPGRTEFSICSGSILELEYSDNKEKKVKSKISVISWIFKIIALLGISICYINIFNNDVSDEKMVIYMLISSLVIFIGVIIVSNCKRKYEKALRQYRF